MNTVQITGRLTRDPELRSTTSGEPVCSLRVAVDGMGRSNSAGYIDVAVWGKPGEACARHLKRGALVGVHGRLEYREWETTDGAKRSAHAIVGNVDFLATARTVEPVASDEPVAA
jgi:single-strand DNA-binding protein